MADSSNNSWLIVVGVILFIWYVNGEHKSTRGDADESAYAGSYDPTYAASPDVARLSRDEAIALHWDEIKGHLNGTLTIDACRLGGNCYNLNADVSAGMIDTLYFPNGGFLRLGADIDSDGSASDVDERGDVWEFQLDQYSGEVDDAIRDWADSTGQELE